MLSDFVLAKKDDSPFSKNPLFSNAAGGQVGGSGPGATGQQGLGNSASSNQLQHQKQGDGATASSGTNSPAPTTIGGGHLFPMSPAYNGGPSTRKESVTATTASPGLSKNDRKLSLTQVSAISLQIQKREVLSKENEGQGLMWGPNR